ncbi:MAG: BLUF domain-containing protein [Burkholderiaceae bacterium]
MTYQIIYSSEATTPMQSEDLEEILEHARCSNATRGITGALVYGEGIFLQILEGDRVTVNDLMVKILRDLRHEAVTVLREGEIPSAIFVGWKMAYISATTEQVAKWAGLSVVTGTTEGLNDMSNEIDRTARFAQDILSLLVPDGTTQTKV